MQKIAVIDPDFTNVELLRKILAKAGYEVLPIVIAGTTYHESIPRVQGFQPDLVLINHVLGIDEVNGSHLVRALCIPKGKLAGIAEKAGKVQPYCGQWFPIGKDGLESGAAKEKLVSFVKAALS